MGGSMAEAAAVQVHDAILVPTGEGHALAQNLAALGIDQPDLAHPFRGVAKGLEVRTQACAARIADAEFLNELRITYATLGQILYALAMTMQFQLVESSGLGEQLGTRSELFGQVSDALMEREMARQFDKANQVAAPPTAVTEKQVFRCVDVERGMLLLMQRAESDELWPSSDALPLPLVPI